MIMIMMMMIIKPRAGETAQCAKVLTAKPDNLNSVPGSQRVEGEDQLSQIVL